MTCIVEQLGPLSFTAAVEPSTTPKPQNPKSVMSKLIVSELINSSIYQFNVKIEKYKFLQR
jgi:hypothetical protein